MPPKPPARRVLKVLPNSIDPDSLKRNGQKELFGPCHYTLQEDGTLLCPGLKLLRPMELRKHPKTSAVRFGAKGDDCKTCPMLSKCMTSVPRYNIGRRIELTLLEGAKPYWTTEEPERKTTEEEQSHGKAATLQEKQVSMPKESKDKPIDLARLLPVPCGPAPIIWVDIPAATARRALIEHLRSQKVDIELPEEQPKPQVTMKTRNERAHRRLTWEERMVRNARQWSKPIIFKIYGLSPTLAAAISGHPAVAA